MSALMMVATSSDGSRGSHAPVSPLVFVFQIVGRGDKHMDFQSELETRHGGDFAEYLDLISKLPTISERDAKIRNKHERGSVDLHHILPQETFPEYADVEENQIYVSYDDHKRLHYLLCLAAPDVWSYQEAVRLMFNCRAAEIVDAEKMIAAQALKRMLARTSKERMARIAVLRQIKNQWFLKNGLSPDDHKTPDNAWAGELTNSDAIMLLLSYGSIDSVTVGRYQTYEASDSRWADIKQWAAIHV
jgi:hypothetical protein